MPHFVSLFPSGSLTTRFIVAMHLVSISINLLAFYHECHSLPMLLAFCSVIGSSVAEWAEGHFFVFLKYCEEGSDESFE